MKGHENFRAKHPGPCAGCGKSIYKGDWIWTPKPKGGVRAGYQAGRFHARCQPPVTVRQATPQELAVMRARMADAKRKALSAYR